MTFWHTLPKAIKEHPYRKVWGPIWSEMHNYDRMVVVVICGRPGKGKTNVMATIAELLDRGSDNIPRFNPEEMMCYKSTQFTEIIQRTDLKKGRVVCLDDAELILYNKETLTRVAIEIGKILATMRYKNLLVLMTLPHFQKLEAHARSYADYYIEVVDRDVKTQDNLVKIQKLTTNPFSGKTYRRNLLVSTERPDPLFGVMIKSKTKTLFRIPRAGHELEAKYKRREVSQKDLSIKAGHNKIAAIEDGGDKKIKKKKLKFADLFHFVHNNIQMFLDQNGKISKSKIMLLADKNGRLLNVSDNMARNVVAAMKDEREDV